MKWFHYVMLGMTSALVAGLVDARLRPSSPAAKILKLHADLIVPVKTPARLDATYKDTAAPLSEVTPTPSPAVPSDPHLRDGLPTNEQLRAMLDCRDTSTVIPMYYSGIETPNYDLRLRPMEWLVQNKDFGAVLIYTRSAGIPDAEKVAMFGESITARLRERREAEARITELVTAHPEMAAMPGEGEDAIHSERLAAIRQATGYDMQPAGETRPSIIGTVYGLDMAAAALGEPGSPLGIAPLLRLADAEANDAAKNPFRSEMAKMPGVGMWVDSHWDLASLGLIADSLDRIIVAQKTSSAKEYATWREGQKWSERTSLLVNFPLSMTDVKLRPKARGIYVGRIAFQSRYEAPIPWQVTGRKGGSPLTDEQVPYIIEFARSHPW